MKMNKLFFLLTFFLVLHSKAQKSELINTYNRSSILLNGSWHYIVDPYENGYYNYRYEAFDLQKNSSKNAYFTNSKPKDKSDLIEYNFDDADTLTVPGDWNTQKEKLYYYEGSIWYKKSFDYTKKASENRVFLHFGAVNYKAEVYLNGKKLGTHIGGFTPFNFEVTNTLKDKDNFIIVKVDNKRTKAGVPTLNTDWWNYGGITRDVSLIETSSTFISDYFVHLNPNDANSIKGHLTLNGASKANQKVLINIPELKIKKQIVTDEKGEAKFEFKSKKIKYWSPKEPKLYAVFFEYNGKLKDEIGFRTIATEDSKIKLNGESIFLKGISLHEESPITKSRANTVEDAQAVISQLKALGCNYVRLSHYPHNEHIVRLAEKEGILIWEENPVYWTIQWDNTSTYVNAKNQLDEMIFRDKNRAAVIIWSMANETPVSKSRNTFLKNLIKEARAKDPTRLISAAMEVSSNKENSKLKSIEDPLAELVDVLSFNQYYGWYVGTPEICKEVQWNITQNKPVVISEFGAGAKYGLHGLKTERWTEEYQEFLYVETLQMLSQIKQWSGVSPWILFDFRSPRRPLPKIQDDYNRKGLISEKGEKKKAFYVLQEFYDTHEID